MQKKDVRLHKLKYWRGVLQLSQDDMGLLLGYTGANYCQKEKGAVDIGLKEITTILKAFNKQLKKMEQPEVKFEDVFIDKGWTLSV